MNFKVYFVAFFLFACANNPTIQNEAFKTKITDGIVLKCSDTQKEKLISELTKYFDSIGVYSKYYQVKRENGLVNFVLNTPNNDTNTLDLYKRPEYNIRDEVVHLGTRKSKKKVRSLDVVTVSKKEIALALMQHGRMTVFENEHCNSQSVEDHIGVRQNIVAWTERVEFDWPDGDDSKWNKKYWVDGNPVLKNPLHVLFNDLVKNSKKYSIYCYTATKAVIVQGILDYYNRVKPDKDILASLENILMIDNDPLVGIEPDPYLKPEEQIGKLLNHNLEIPKNNFIPGDWFYIRNTDLATRSRTGYEGSNSIYLGRNYLNDFYNDNNHRFIFEEKVNEVYQWRNHVFSFSRDQGLIKPLSHTELQSLFNSPDTNGVVSTRRISPDIYSLPSINTKVGLLKKTEQKVSVNE